MRRLFTNPAAAIVMVGVCVLPSLYAWFNIAANMDPYGNTSNIKVAIANCDTGASTETISLDAGGTIVDTLKENKQLGWTFVDEKQAKAGVTSGKYYAAIVIPKNFSESLLSILDGEVKQPELDYYINEKKKCDCSEDHCYRCFDHSAADQRHVFFGSRRNCIGTDPYFRR